MITPETPVTLAVTLALYEVVKAMLHDTYGGMQQGRHNPTRS